VTDPVIFELQVSFIFTFLLDQSWNLMGLRGKGNKASILP